MKTNIITFTSIYPEAVTELPIPSSKILPNWYKNTPPYRTGGKVLNKRDTTESTNGTIKKCMPVFDALTAGYMILLPADVFVTNNGDEKYFQWASHELISFHPIEQANLYPKIGDKKSTPKWMNPWAIKTKKGYSSLFVQPFHRESVFTILPGIVDTDNYTAPVNLPFILNDPDFEGLIPAGTPIAQVIPFKRESWNMQIGTKKDFDDYIYASKKISTKFFDRYKTLFWNKKEYR